MEVQASEEKEPITIGGEIIRFTEPWDVRGTLANVGGAVIEFDAAVDTEVHMTCSRCMKDVRLPLHITVRQRFAPEQNPDGNPAEPEDDVMRFHGYRIDLQETIAEEVQLAIPMKVLCREDCKGLCPSCGKDLNEGPCGCHHEETDPRWDALKGLLH
ncbi:MAG: YceD family protein [Clostridia bacterium]